MMGTGVPWVSCWDPPLCGHILGDVLAERQLVCAAVLFSVVLWLIQINSIKQPTKSNSVSPGNMSHCRTSAFYDHLDHRFIVFEHIQQSFLMRRQDVGGNTINIIQCVDLPLRSLIAGRPGLSVV